MKLFKSLLGVFVFLQTVTIYAAHPLTSLIENKWQTGTITTEAVKDLRSRGSSYVDEHGRVTPDLQSALDEIETRYFDQMNADARLEFQKWVASVGGTQHHPIQLPKEEQSFWQLEKGRLDQFRSTANLPKKADYVVIGAGLTGTSAAYHLIEAAKAGKSVVVLEAGTPAAQASGKNGGNFQLLHESYIGHYEGLIEERYKWLRSQNPTASNEDLMRTATEQTRVLFDLTLNNFNRFRNLVEKEKIACDFSSRGWLRIASSKEEEEALIRDTQWIASLGIGPKTEIWTPDEIEKKTQIHSQYFGRYIYGNGNYHPKKFITEVLGKAISQGISLYTGVTVTKVENRDEHVNVETSLGSLETSKVIVATNAFTPKLFPQLKAIETYVSQIMNLEHVSHSLDGMTLTELGGDIYYNFPRSTHYLDSSQKTRGMLHFGMDLAGGPASDPAKIERSLETFRAMKALTDDRFPETRGQPPSRVWVGPMAFTPDRVPVIGFLDPAGSKNIVIAAAFQGYGGSYCIEAGYIAAQMAMTGVTSPEVPPEIFAPQRFLENQR